MIYRPRPSLYTVAMRNVRASLIAALLTVLICAAVLPARADFDAGMKAYEAGDYETAMKEWLPLAQKNNAKAQYFVGTLYDFATSTAPNIRQAFQWYRLSAENGYAEAQFTLGDILSRGTFGEKNDREALRWYRLAAEQNHPAGLLSTGLMYIGGQGVEPDYAEGFMWLYLAKTAGANNAEEAIKYFFYWLGETYRITGYRRAQERIPTR